MNDLIRSYIYQRKEARLKAAQTLFNDIPTPRNGEVQIKAYAELSAMNSSFQLYASPERIDQFCAACIEYCEKYCSKEEVTCVSESDSERDQCLASEISNTENRD